MKLSAHQRHVLQRLLDGWIYPFPRCHLIKHPMRERCSITTILVLERKGMVFHDQRMEVNRETEEWRYINRFVITEAGRAAMKD